MAHWARGKHLLSLGRFREAVDALTANVDCLADAGKSRITVDPEGLFSAAAYLGLAKEAAGDPLGHDEYQRAVTDLTTLRDRDEKRRDDAQVYIDQLQVTRRLMGL